MPGSEIPKVQRDFLSSIVGEAGVIATVVTKHVSINLHAPLILLPKPWKDGGQPDSETLLGVSGALGPSGEPPAHFHVDWNRLTWAALIEFRLDRVGTRYALLMFPSEPGTADTRDLREQSVLRFYLTADSPFARRLLESHKLDTPFPIG